MKLLLAPRFKRWRVGLAFVAVTIAFVIGLVLISRVSDETKRQAVQAKQQSAQLALLVQEMQKSRVLSCKRTYEGVREIFKPFFRPPAKRTPKERHDIRKFNRRVDHLKRRCDMQVSTKGKP